ncbi:MAG: hypothetical protein JSS29_13275 [Proteobacteria bacterium]|nr:hypothetical protein [Pseudomonadota bacterium]
MAAPEDRKVRSLAELPQAVDLPRDLWPQLQAQLKAAPVEAAAPVPGTRARVAPLRWLAAAATVAALAVGVFIGRGLGPVSAPGTPVAQTGTPAPQAAPLRDNAALDAAFVSDPRYERQRAELVQSLQARLNAMPGPARAKVMASLTAIETAKKDLENALGKDPSNALLQELLINTYQDEMRALTDVHEAGESGKGI